MVRYDLLQLDVCLFLLEMLGTLYFYFCTKMVGIYSINLNII